MTSTARQSGAISRGRLGFAGLLLLVYAAPLFYPPEGIYPVTTADAGFLERLFPGVPPLWVGVRLAALAMAAMVLSGASVSAVQQPFRATSPVSEPAGIGVLRPLALGVALLHAASAPCAVRLGSAGQTLYLLMLGMPALLLAWSRSSPLRLRPRRWRLGLPTAAVILLWTLWCLVRDLNSTRVADVVDGWRGYVDTVIFFERSKNLLTDLFDPELPGVGAAILFFHGLPLFRSGLVPLSFAAVQVLQILWLAACAAGVGVLARMLVGPGVSLIAAAVFLFAPYTRFVSLFPGPFLVGPIYAVALALCALAACRRRSEAGLAALGAVSGIGLTYPGVVPTVALFAGLTVWHLRGCWRRLWVGFAAGLAAFAAAVVPAVPNVLTPGPMTQHFRLHGAVTLLEPTLMGQLPVRTSELARSTQVWRPFDIIAAAVIEPFANPRTSFRLWGDAIFDPLGAALMAIGLVACVRSARASPAARFLLLFFVVALCPAFVSPVDRVDIVHAVALPVPAALLASAGFAVLQRQLGWKPWRQHVTAVAAAMICVAGIVLFDVVNPGIITASSMGIMFRALRAEDAGRVLVLNYPHDFSADVRWLMTGPMTAFAGERPVGYLEYGGEFPASDLPAEGKDLLFWSPGLEQDSRVADAVCRQWPGATLYELWDEAGLGRVYAARVDGRRGWEPRTAAHKSRSWACASRGAPPEALPAQPLGH